MYVILIGVEHFNPQRRIFLHRGVEDFFEFGEHIGLEEFSSVLGAPDDMVLVLIGAVVKLTGSHGTSVSHRMRDVQGSIHPRAQLRPNRVRDGRCARGSLVVKRPVA